MRPLQPETWRPPLPSKGITCPPNRGKLTQAHRKSRGRVSGQRRPDGGADGVPGSCPRCHRHHGLAGSPLQAEPLALKSIPRSPARAAPLLTFGRADSISRPIMELPPRFFTAPQRSLHGRTLAMPVADFLRTLHPERVPRPERPRRPARLRADDGYPVLPHSNAPGHRGRCAAAHRFHLTRLLSTIRDAVDVRFHVSIMPHPSSTL